MELEFSLPDRLTVGLLEFLGRRQGLCSPRKARAWEGGGAPGGWADHAALALAPVVRLVRLCGCAAVRLHPVAVAVGVSVGYVHWVGVWARAWEGRAARGAQRKSFRFFF